MILMRKKEKILNYLKEEKMEIHIFQNKKMSSQ